MSATGHTVEAVRGERTPELDGELLEFWAANSSLTDEAARARLADVVCVLRDQEGALAATASVQAAAVPAVGGRRFWVYRTLAPTPAARAALDHMVRAAFRQLEREWNGGAGEPIGICVRITDRSVMERRREPVWPISELMFAGYTPAGAQLRIAYFDRAKIVF